MTDDITPERQRQIEELLGAAISDPDPDRRVVACDDCRTPMLAATDDVLFVIHDPTCPTYLAMSPSERVETDEDEGLTVVHGTGGQPG